MRVVKEVEGVRGSDAFCKGNRGDKRIWCVFLQKLYRRIPYLVLIGYTSCQILS